MTKVYTIAKMTGSGRDQGGYWAEPEIGCATYGKLSNVPPVFTNKEKALEYAYSIGLFLKTKHDHKRFILVEMELR